MVYEKEIRKICMYYYVRETSSKCYLRQYDAELYMEVNKRQASMSNNYL